MELLLLAFGWLGFIFSALFCAAMALDWYYDRSIPLVQRMNAVSMMADFDRRMSRLSEQCEAMRHELDSYERNWVSVESFCSLKSKVEEMDSGIMTSRAMNSHVHGLQRRVRMLEEQIERISREETK